MRIDRVKIPKSSFLSISKDLNIIANKIFQSKRLQRLLYYTSKDCLDQPNLTEEQTIKLFENNIKIVPKIYVDGTLYNYIIITFDNFSTNETNPQFRDNIIEFDIICHIDQWHLKDFQLRPYLIAAEIDSALDGQRLTGIGKTEFAGSNIIVLTDEYVDLCLTYRVVHGDEDKKNILNPTDEEQFLKDFYSQFENL